MPDLNLSTDEPTVAPIIDGYRNIPMYPIDNNSFKGERVKDKDFKPSLTEKSLEGGYSVAGMSADFERLAVAQALGVNDFQNKGAFHDQTERLIEWARMSGAKNTQQVIMKIHELEQQLGGGKSRTNLYKLAVYAGIKLQDYYDKKKK